MRGNMQVKPQINPAFTEIEIHVCNHELNEQVRQVTSQIATLVNDSIAGTSEKGVRLLTTSEIIRFYAENQKVFAQNADGIFSVHQKLYELEQQLDSNQFVRISKSEIVNLYKIKRLDMDHVGTIRVILSGEIQTFTSRRNISRLKKALGLVDSVK